MDAKTKAGSGRQRVAVLGASSKPERYSNKAVVMLKERGHEVLPVHPVEATIEGLRVYGGLASIPGPIDTVSVYVGPRNVGPMIPEIVAARPGRVILNPGAESEELERALTASGIPVLKACTLVLLTTGQF